MKKEEVKTENVPLLFLKVKSVPSGIEVYAKSEKLEAFFRAASGGQVAPSSENREVWTGEYYKTPRTILQEDGKTFEFSKVGLEPMLNPENNWINLSFLRKKGLGEGVKFTFTGVYPKIVVRGFLRLASQAIKTLYLEQIKSTMVVVEISVKETEVV